MMKKLLIVLFAGLLAACSDFLEPKSQSEYIPREAAALRCYWGMLIYRRQEEKKL